MHEGYRASSFIDEVLLNKQKAHEQEVNKRNVPTHLNTVTGKTKAGTRSDSHSVLNQHMDELKCPNTSKSMSKSIKRPLTK